MEISARIILALGLASLFVSSTTVAAADAVFGYGNGPNGPQHWGSLNPQWRLCNGGGRQSPINIAKENITDRPKPETLARDYADAKATLVNNGYNIMVRYDEGVGTAFIEEKNYSLQQVHWHMPSEHTLNGERYDAELHMVHKKDNFYAVVAILYKIGHPDTFLNQLMDGLEKLAKEKCSDNQEASVPVGVIDNKSLRRSTKKYYRYEGSLTAPPCNEGVIWSILGKVREMSPAQAAALRAPLAEAYRNNSRPIQPSNGRSVWMVDEGKNKEDGPDA
ncbi:alpha carbonic anhydrase 1, chloroplastic-like isoform X2 [Asparagus officinalis]|uniref:alpha carbonic anhydrase 1, chloroplastic-like isoform X2 n=1 Tax=Asparagus officinalis TaxID=4686 RepID=UPI00098E31BF|nr:alpha carbonic anhydrase 1, chloroplastic-like isoform X2 [Asparagus officinalis]